MRLAGPQAGACPRLASARLRPSCPHKLVAPRIVASSSSKKDGADSKDKDPDPRKADFSAYWSLKIKEFFDNRRKFLEEIDRRGIPESATVRKLEDKAQEQLDALRSLEAEERQLKQIKLEARQQLDAQAAADAERLFKTTSKPVPMPPAVANAVVVEDIERARASLRTAAVSGLAVNMYRARELVRMVLMSPISLAMAAMKQWSALYSSQSYENFLMSEGERIWYWRNRTENERWFWEIAFWERLAMPILCTVAYELLVPNNFIWAVLVPLTLIYIQSGELPSPRGVEFWLIGYFGFYRKCWPDVLPLLKALVFQA